MDTQLTGGEGKALCIGRKYKKLHIGSRTLYCLSNWFGCRRGYLRPPVPDLQQKRRHKDGGHNLASNLIIPSNFQAYRRLRRDVYIARRRRNRSIDQYVSLCLGPTEIAPVSLLHVWPCVHHTRLFGQTRSQLLFLLSFKYTDKVHQMDPEEQSSLLAPSREQLSSVKVFPLIPYLKQDAIVSAACGSPHGRC